jgi:hypothetical protein
VKAHINKAKSQIGTAKYLFSNKEIDIRMKHSIYTSFAINTAQWGCELWSLSAKNKTQLESFHHSMIRRIHNKKWERV